MIIEIALGIVLAVIILANLELVFNVAIWLALAAAVLAVAGAAIYWLIDQPERALVLVFIGGLAYLIWRTRNLNLNDWFLVPFVKDLFRSTESRERDRRKKLGYDD